MIILGLSHLSPSPVGHDTTAALLEDGVLRSAVSEERLSRIKHHAGYPANAIQYCLNESRIRMSDIDKVVVGFGLHEDQIEDTTRQKHFGFAKTDGLFRKTL
jgi:predicted NodU family carbamoyl transferase